MPPLRSTADWYSQPSDMPSPSVSGLQGSVPIAASTVSGTRSLSSSASLEFWTPSPSQSPVAPAAAPPTPAALGAISGEALVDV